MTKDGEKIETLDQLEVTEERSEEKWNEEKWGDRRWPIAV